MQNLPGPYCPGNLVARLFRGQWPYTRLFGVGPHWYRPYPSLSHTNGPCAYLIGRGRCDRPMLQHWQAVGEWDLPFHQRWNAIRRRAWARLAGHGTR